MMNKIEEQARKEKAELLVDKEIFCKDVLLGLSQKNKKLSSKYFYDDKGGELFNQITHHPDYYLTNCELEILTTYKQNLALFFKNKAFNLIELGPGEGIKTRILIEGFLQEQLNFRYFPIDISANYLSHISASFQKTIPKLKISTLNSDYLNGIKWVCSHSDICNLVLFLGSSIGNFDLESSKDFLKQIRKALRPGDYLLIGFDLLKEISVLTRAYNDSDGLTRAFNLNLLARMNNELGANFDLQSFDHYGNYNIYTHAMESYLLSTKAQQIYISALDRSFDFAEFEPIHVESSQKYSLPQIKDLATLSDFQVIENFSDSKHYFINSLWCAN